MRQVQFMVSGVKSAPLTAGKHKAGRISNHQPKAIAPNGLDQRPRCQGPAETMSAITYLLTRASYIPGLNLPLSKNSLRATGVVKAVYCAMAPMLKTAPMATGLANINKPSK